MFCRGNNFEKLSHDWGEWNHIGDIQRCLRPLCPGHSTIPKGGRTVPIVVSQDGEKWKNSSIILDECSKKIPWLYSTSNTKVLEDYFDKKLGPHVRRFAYGIGFTEFDEVSKRLILDPINDKYEGYAAHISYPLLKSLITKALNINSITIEKSLSRIEHIF